MNTLIAGLAVAGAMLTSSIAHAQSEKPTIVLVHGAFEDTSSWNGVIRILRTEGYPVVAVANPLRSLKGDADYVADILSSINSPVVLVGHAYGGAVISGAANNRPNVNALVFVSAFVPDEGETAAGLAGKFPGPTFAAALAPPVTLSTGGKDLYIQQDKFHDQVAPDVAEADTQLMAVTQRPITEAAANEKSGHPAWKDISSWFIYGDADKNIPPQALAFMAERAHPKQTVVVEGASHAVMVSNPVVVAKVIESAAAANK